jgi:hypothetical protein
MERSTYVYVYGAVRLTNRKGPVGQEAYEEWRICPSRLASLTRSIDISDLVSTATARLTVQKSRHNIRFFGDTSVQTENLPFTDGASPSNASCSPRFSVSEIAGELDECGFFFSVQGSF